MLYEEDKELARRALVGDDDARRAFALRLGCLSRQVSAVCKRLGVRLDEDQRRDLVQDVSATVWAKLETYEGLATLEAWTWPFVRFAVQNRARAKARAPRLDPLAGTEAHENSHMHPSIAETPTLDRSVLERCLAALPKETALVLRLKHLSGLQFSEIGARLGEPEGTVKSRYHRGLKAARAVAARLIAEDVRRV